MRLARDRGPFVWIRLREKSIALEVGIDLCDDHSLGNWRGDFEKFRAADHEYLGHIADQCERGIEACNDFCPGGAKPGAARDDDAASPGQRAADGIPRASAHDDRRTHRRPLEVRE